MRIIKSDGSHGDAPHTFSFTVNPKPSAPPGGGSGDKITLFEITPGSPSDAQRVHATCRVRWWADFRSMRFWFNGPQHEMANLRQVGDLLEISADIDVGSLPRGTHTVACEAATKSDLNWTNAERRVMSYTLTGTQTPPSSGDPGESRTWNIQYYNHVFLSNEHACGTSTHTATHLFKQWRSSDKKADCTAVSWSARFKRRVHFSAGTYQFRLEAGSETKILINGQLMVRRDAGETSKNISFTNDGHYDVDVEFQAQGGDAHLAVWWIGLGVNMPRENPDPSQWYAEYWGNSEQKPQSEPVISVRRGTGTGAGGFLNEDWGSDSPGWGLPGDLFSTRFTRTVTFPTCGQYRFYLTKDDRGRVSIDGLLVPELNQWQSSRSDHNALVGLSAGAHIIVVEQTEDYGWARVKLEWGTTPEVLCIPPTRTPTPTATLTPTRTSTPPPTITQVANATGFASITANDLSTCGLTSAGAAYCWGSNAYGHLGDGTSTNRNTPVAVSGGLTFAFLAPGAWHACGLTAEGKAYCWGLNQMGQLGDGSTTDRHVPVLVSGGHVFARLESGRHHTCGLTVAGTAYCWGYNGYGQLGDGTGNPDNRSSPNLVSGGIAFADLAAGWMHTCGITAAGVASCWGRADDGQLGDGTLSTIWRDTPVTVGGGRIFDSSSLVAGNYHTCAVTGGGAAYCWGNNESGQLGDGTTTARSAPVLVNGGFAFARLEAGGWYNCGLTASRSAYCWGANDVGQLGDGTATQRTEPRLVSGGHSFTHLAAGDYHTCALTVTQGAYCWGRNDLGQLGDNTAIGRTGPAAVAMPGPPITATRTATRTTTPTHTATRTWTPTTTPTRTATRMPSATIERLNRAVDAVGGNLSAGGGKLGLRVPPGALHRSVDLVIAPATPPATRTPGAGTPVRKMRPVGHTFDLRANPVTPVGTTLGAGTATPFAQPVEISVAYDPQDLHDVDPLTLGIFYFDTTQLDWVSIPSRVDTQAQTITGTTDHFTVFGVLASLVTPTVPPAAAAPVSAPEAPPAGVPGGSAVTPEAPAPIPPDRGPGSPPISTTPAPTAQPGVPAGPIRVDLARGVVAITRPGTTTALELPTGYATTTPDAYCPTARHRAYLRLDDVGIAGATFGVEPGGALSWVTPDQAGCVNWEVLHASGATFTKDVIMQFELARAAPGALLWVLEGARYRELYEVDPLGIARYVSGEYFVANQAHFTAVWANVIPVSTTQINGLERRGVVRR